MYYLYILKNKKDKIYIDEYRGKIIGVGVYETR